MSSWLGLFAAIWLERDADRIEETPRCKHDRHQEQSVGGSPPRRASWKRWAPGGESEQLSTAVSARRVAQGHSHAGVAVTTDSVVGLSAKDSGCERVDLFPKRPSRTGSRFDQTVALPIDAPEALDATIRTLVLRLRALPQVVDLGRRSAPYRLQLERTLAEAIRARSRLRDGGYGKCAVCSAPISLTLLTEKPWSSTCIYCALGIR